jgi:hypothetical protein
MVFLKASATDHGLTVGNEAPPQTDEWKADLRY